MSGYESKEEGEATDDSESYDKILSEDEIAMDLETISSSDARIVGDDSLTLVSELGSNGTFTEAIFRKANMAELLKDSEFFDLLTNVTKPDSKEDAQFFVEDLREVLNDARSGPIVQEDLRHQLLKRRSLFVSKDSEVTDEEEMTDKLNISVTVNNTKEIDEIEKKSPEKTVEKRNPETSLISISADGSFSSSSETSLTLSSESSISLSSETSKSSGKKSDDKKKPDAMNPKKDDRQTSNKRPLSRKRDGRRRSISPRHDKRRSSRSLDRKRSSRSPYKGWRRSKSSYKKRSSRSPYRKHNSRSPYSDRKRSSRSPYRDRKQNSRSPYKDRRRNPRSPHNLSRRSLTPDRRRQRNLRSPSRRRSTSPRRWQSRSRSRSRGSNGRPSRPYRTMRSSDSIRGSSPLRTKRSSPTTKTTMPDGRVVEKLDSVALKVTVSHFKSDSCDEEIIGYEESKKYVSKTTNMDLRDELQKKRKRTFDTDDMKLSKRSPDGRSISPAGKTRTQGERGRGRGRGAFSNKYSSPSPNSSTSSSSRERNRRRKKKERTPFLAELAKKLMSSEFVVSKINEIKSAPPEVTYPHSTTLNQTPMAFPYPAMDPALGMNMMGQQGFVPNCGFGMNPSVYQEPTMNIMMDPMSHQQNIVPSSIAQRNIVPCSIAEQKFFPKSIAQKTTFMSPVTKHQTRNLEVLISPVIPPLSDESLDIALDFPPSNGILNLSDDKASALVRLANTTFAKAEVISRYRLRHERKKEEEKKLTEITKNLGVNSSKSGVRTSTPARIKKRKNEKETECPSKAPVTILKAASARLRGNVPSSFTSPDLENHESPVRQSKIKENTPNVEVEELSDDPIISKVEKAILHLTDHYNPPPEGRFIIHPICSKRPSSGKLKKTESPLRSCSVVLRFITPDIDSDPYPHKDSARQPFEFKIEEKHEKDTSCDLRDLLTKLNFKLDTKESLPPKRTAFTFESAVQCDLATDEVAGFRNAVEHFKKEAARLTNVNANLKEAYHQTQARLDATTLKLHEAQKTILNRDNEIRNLTTQIRPQAEPTWVESLPPNVAKMMRSIQEQEKVINSLRSRLANAMEANKNKETEKEKREKKIGSSQTPLRLFQRPKSTQTARLTDKQVKTLNLSLCQTKIFDFYPQASDDDVIQIKKEPGCVDFETKKPEFENIVKVKSEPITIKREKI